MQSFKRLFNEMWADEGFRTLYARECHVCGYTVQAVARIEALGLDMAELAGELGVPMSALEQLRTADWCDPSLVIDLCRHLGIAGPRACPRMPP